MNIDTLKTASIRKAFGTTLAKLGEENEKIVVLDADLACSTQTKIFQEKFPNRFFDCGIAEQDMISTAAGLAVQGKIPFAASFAVFATGRAYDQIRNTICYSNLNVKIVGTHGGITVGEDGATHQSLEDISLMRGLPNMTVIVPSDCTECEKAINFAAKHKGPVYIRIPRSNVVNIFETSDNIDICKANIIKNGNDITIYTNGETLCETIIAAQILEKENISVKIINVPMVKPLDFKTIIEESKNVKFIVTVENHSVIGGLGSAICETISGSAPKKIFRIGINDEFGQSGDAKELMKHYELDSISLANRIREIYQKEVI